MSKMKAVPKKYGLILKKPAEPPKPAVKPIAAAFADDDDDGNEATSSSKISASIARVQMQAKREHEKALAEDPTVFDYDNIYDELQTKKNEKIAEVKAADKERKSKYAEQILEAHKKRLLAQQSREERKQQKEREAEAGQFDDKEKFVTSAYRQQLAEMEKFRLQEAADNRLDELTAVEKQKSGMWKGGFYRTLLSDIARDGSTVKTEEKEIKHEVVEPEGSQEITVDPEEHAKKLSSLRKNSNKDEMLPQLSSATSNKPTRKSIYSDTSDEEPATSSAAPVQLKPGLNILKSQTKKPTKAEQVRRRFTPSPEHSATSSSEEESSKERRRRTERKGHGKERRSHEREKRRRRSVSPTEKSPRRHHRRSRSRERHPAENERKESKKSDDKHRIGKAAEREPKKGIVKEKTKAERMGIIRKILAHQNGQEEIEQMRQRYFERKRDEIVPLPL